jgi:hypothetical protein
LEQIQEDHPELELSATAPIESGSLTIDNWPFFLDDPLRAVNRKQNLW